jgi:hypothetical protein
MRNFILYLILLSGLLSCKNSGSDSSSQNTDLVKKNSDPESGLVNPAQVSSVFDSNLPTEFGERIKIKLSPYIPDYKGFLEEEKAMLSSRLNSAIAEVGYGGEGSNPRFIIGPAITILSSEVTPGAPTLYSIKYEINFLVADIIDETVFASYTTQFAGVGQSHIKSFINGFNNVNLKTSEFYSFLKKAEQKISEYYSINCEKFLLQADAEIKDRNFDAAYTILKNIPAEAGDCFKKAQAKRELVFKNYIRSNCNDILLKMKGELGKMNDQTGSGFNDEAMAYYSLIDKESPCYSEAEKIYQGYLKGLKPAQKRDWELKIKQMEQQMNYRTDSLNATNAFNLKMKELEVQSEIQGNKALLDKYKEDYYYDRLPWLRRIFHLGKLDPFDGYSKE